LNQVRRRTANLIATLQRCLILCKMRMSVLCDSCCWKDFIFWIRFVAHLASLVVSSHRQSMSLQLSKMIISCTPGSISQAVAKHGPAELVMPVLIGRMPFYPCIL
jgi:hypothetical protein